LKREVKSRMGACASNLTPEEQEANKRNREISKQLKKDREQQSVKLLLLGTGESGKSTILKQMKILHQRADGPDETVGLTKEDREAQVTIIRQNVIDSMGSLLDAAVDFDYPLAASSKEAQQKVRDVWEKEEYARYQEIVKDIVILWEDPSIQKCIEQKAKIQLLDSAPYFLKKAVTIGAADYLPTDDDVLRARSQTTGVVTVDFTLKENKRELKLELVDVGGQRGERRRWIHCFEGVTAVMFIISLSDYNQVLWEDETTNRMLEAEKLFGDMLNNVFFRETPFIVFFNKWDLFKDKLKEVPLTEAYKEYTGPKDAENDEAKVKHAVEFIEEKFTSQNQNRDRGIYRYHTTATDTDLVKNVMGAVQTIIFRQILGEVF